MVVVVQRRQLDHTIASPEDALELLLSDWPTNGGLPLISAMEACAGAIAGTVSEEEAQYAFLEAALDAGIDFEFKPSV
ncbi:hypothetical protein ATY81_16685 [Rhizobium sp. R72]|nr:hypothetical protein ATY81_16685 [Rhizobium sp. R72]OWV92997.1 hypothetical protein ATY80_16685 [Rhizobium sp. R711]